MGSKSNPLSLDSFNRLSSCIYLHAPPSRNLTNDTKSPDTILLCTWMGASPRHINKYISTHSILYPDAQILVITSSPADFTYRLAFAPDARLSPIMTALKANPPKRLLLHIFSNGGARQAALIMSAFREATGTPIPVVACILDSTPGRGTYKRSFAAFAASFPKHKSVLRVFGSLFIHLFLITFFLLHHGFGVENPVARSWEALNDERMMMRGAPRCYMYSDNDDMVYWKDVEDHATEAERKGWRVRRQKFRGPHVGHMRENEGLYWKLVESLWDLGVSCDK